MASRPSAASSPSTASRPITASRSSTASRPSTQLTVPPASCPRFGGTDTPEALVGVCTELGLLDAVSITTRATVSNVVLAVWHGSVHGSMAVALNSTKKALRKLGFGMVAKLVFGDGFFDTGYTDIVTAPRRVFAFLIVVLNYAHRFAPCQFNPTAVLKVFTSNPNYTLFIHGKVALDKDALVHKFRRLTEPPTREQLDFFAGLARPSARKVETGRYINVHAVSLPVTKRDMTNVLNIMVKASMDNQQLVSLFEQFEASPDSDKAWLTPQPQAAGGSEPATWPKFASAIGTTRGESGLNLVFMIFSGTETLGKDAGRALIARRVKLMLMNLGFPANLNEFNNNPDSTWRVLVAVLNYPGWFTTTRVLTGGLTGAGPSSSRLRGPPGRAGTAKRKNTSAAGKRPKKEPRSGP